MTRDSRLFAALRVGLCLSLSSPCVCAAGSGELVYFGTMGAGGFGPPSAAVAAPENPPTPTGIFAARLDTKTGKLTGLGLQAELTRATWLTANPALPVIYSVAQGATMQDHSFIVSFSVDRTTGKLTQIEKVDAGGSDATHMDLDAASNTLFVANHGSGDTTALPIAANGAAGAVTSDQKQTGSGPHRRQTHSQPHGVAVDPSHQYLVSADFGADRLFVYKIDPKSHSLAAANTPFIPTPPGTGPRHLLFSPNGKFLYLDTELTAEMYTYRWDAKHGTATLIGSVKTYPADYAAKEEPSAGEIFASRNGKNIYVSLRGDQNSIVVYGANRQTGQLTEIQRIASQGDEPWNIAIDLTGRWMLVCNDRSNSVNVLAVDPATGKLSSTGESLTVPKPTISVFAK
jgi:6-phosphogluconolactonase